MRNLIKYPITWDEKHQALKEAIDLMSRKYEGYYGNISVAALQEILEDLYRLERLEH